VTLAGPIAPTEFGDADRHPQQHIATLRLGLPASLV
jgi:hypothetical protein